MLLDVLDLLPVFLIGGFFSFLKPILKVALPIVGGILGVEALGAITAPESKEEAKAVVTTGLAPAAAARVAAGTVGAPLSLTTAQAVAIESRGRQRKRTIVETFDPLTGAVLRRTVTMGGVAVFAQDVAAAKRIFRQVRRLDARLPRKTVKQGQIKQLTERVVKNALERAGDDPTCPK